MLLSWTDMLTYLSICGDIRLSRTDGSNGEFIAFWLFDDIEVNAFEWKVGVFINIRMSFASV